MREIRARLKDQGYAVSVPDVKAALDIIQPEQVEASSSHKPPPAGDSVHPDGPIPEDEIDATMGKLC